jgi:hypothetical protein
MSYRSRKQERQCTGSLVEKKSMSLPIVKGMVMETEDDAKSSPVAMRRGFFSSFARDAIFRKEDAL